MYMSKAPNDDVKSYDGSGDWFKIFQEGVCNTNADFTTDAWCTWDRDWIAATIPKDTPSGEYLVRVEHIGKEPHRTRSVISHQPADVNLKASINRSTTNPSTTPPARRSKLPMAAVAVQVLW